MASSDDIIIAGGGIGGLVTALALHRIGRSVQVYESVERIQALGVGINLLPHAVRELEVLGVADALLAIGLAPSTLSYFTKRGEEIWSEPRGVAAGYRWPQISVHRGELHQVLFDAAVRAIGADRIHTGCHLASFDTTHSGVTAWFVDRRTGASTATATGVALIAADGIHSVARAAHYPAEGSPKWSGALLWRGLAEAPRMLDGRTLIWSGHLRQKFIAYPLRDLANDRQLINFIAELRYDSTELDEREDWNKPGELSAFLPHFEDWRFDWLDIPQLIESAEATFVFPMVDRDPVDQWTFGRMTLLGDAAHPMYPVGSNGASQAILDAQVLAGCIRSYPDDLPAALVRYDEVRRPATAGIVMANRGLGPELPMNLVEERAPNGFTRLDDIITPAEIATVTEGYRRTAGFALADLATTPSLADIDY